MKKILAMFVTCFVFIFVLTSCGTKSYAVRFEFNDEGLNIVQNVEEGGKVNKPTDPVKDGCIFLGWYLDDQLYNFNKSVSGNFTLVAKYADALNTVTFIIDDVVINEEVVEYGMMANSVEAPLKEGFDFAGWYLNDELYDFNEAVKDEVVLVGKYSAKVYTVSFETDGADVIEAQNVEHNAVASEPIAPAKEGYVFAGWYLNDELYDFETPVTDNITLVAKWNPELTINDVIGSWAGVEVMYGMELGKINLTIKADQTASAVYDMSGYQSELVIEELKIENNQLVLTYNFGNTGTLIFDYVDDVLVANRGISAGDYGTTTLNKTILDFAVIAGTWVGSESYSGVAIPYTLVIKEDGVVEASFDMFGSVTNLGCKELTNKIVFDYYGIGLTFVFDGTSFYGIGAMGQEVVLNKKADTPAFTLNDVVGTWTGSEEFYGMVFNYEFVINADGTGSAVYGSDAMVTTMTVEKYSIVDGKLVLEYNVDGFDYEPLSFELVDNKLTGTSPMGTIITLSKAISVADFAGTWVGTEVTSFGNYNYTIVLDATGKGTGNYVDEAGLYPSDLTINSLTVDGTKVVISVTDSYSMEYTIEFTFQDGALVSNQGLMWGTLTLNK